MSVYQNKYDAPLHVPFKDGLGLTWIRTSLTEFARFFTMEDMKDLQPDVGIH